MRTCAIVNPVAGGGRATKLWPRLEPQFREASSSFVDQWTTDRGSAERLAREALRNGFERIVAVGGDGTLHEVVNGFFDDGTAVNPEAVLAHVACGSGSDFRRTLGAPTGAQAVAQLESDRINRLDLLRVEATNDSGRSDARYAVNIASFGLSGTVVRALAATDRSFPPRLHYLLAALRALATDRPARVRLVLDDEPLGVETLWLGAIANGHTFAAGLPIAPSATPRDGLFDLTLLHEVPVLSVLRHVHRFYLGTHGSLPYVRTRPGRRLRAEPAEEASSILVEADGENLGRLPATFTLVPGAIRVQY